MSFCKKEMRASLFYLVVGLMFGYLLFHSLAGDTLLSANAYDSYALQAENWLSGRLFIANGENYPWLELAIYQGEYYVSFPPVPSVVLLPVVILCGGAATVPSNLLIALFATATAAGVYLLFAKWGASSQSCLFWALISCLGSNFFWLSTSGGVWFMAQVLNLFFVVWGLYALSTRTLVGSTLGAFFLALAVGCRPFSIAVLALYFLWLWVPLVKKSWHPIHWGKGFWLPFFAALAVGICLAGYNFVRFGSLTEFGHNYLPEFVNASHGQFGLFYFWNNLTGLFRPISLNAALGLEFERFNGFFLLAANPIFLLWLVGLIGCVCHKKITVQELACVGCAVGVLLLLCCHKTMGGWQFGVRYMVDLIPFVWIAAVVPLWQGKRNTAHQKSFWQLPLAGKPAAWQWFLCSLAVAFNIYGALFMLFRA